FSLTKPVQDLSHITRPSEPIIKDWLSDSETESEPKASQFVPSFAQSSEQVKSPRHSIQPFETTIPAATSTPSSPKSNSSGQRRNRKACFVCKSVDHLIKDCNFHTKKMAQPSQRNYAHRGHHNQYARLTHSKPQKHMVSTAVLTQSKPVSNTTVRPVSVALPNITGNSQQALRDKGVIDSGCLRHMTGNTSYLSEFEELNEGYVAFGGNPKGGKITGKGKIKTGKQHRAFCKTKPVSSVDQPLFRLHMDLFGPTFVKIPNKKSYCLVITDDYSRFTWVFFLATKDETSPILKTFITGLENQLSLKVKAEAVNTACYVQNRVLVTKPHNKTSYELLHGRTPSIGVMRPFGCPVTILKSLDPLDKFQRKVDEGFCCRLKIYHLSGLDGVGWDWSYMANDEEDHALVTDEEAPTEFALMANTSTESKVFDNCSKDCKKNNDSLNIKITDLTDKLFDAKNMIYHYKLALAQVESRLVEYKEREVKYIEKIRTLEYYHESKKECIETLKKELETLKQEKEVVDGKLACLLTALKDLDNLIESQRSDKSKEGLGYTAVPPPAQLYLSLKKDLS
nr:hypothetical protein [Tanacetum cinerariifolium]